MHPLTCEPINGKHKHVRKELAAFLPTELGQPRRARMGYDAARDTEGWQSYWANADRRDADSQNSRAVREKLVPRSRYETESNGYYAGIITTHVNMLVGVGPTLRMLTGSRNFNQTVEREWYAWTQRVQLRRKLWCMAHARTADGEGFAVLQTNPGLPADGVQLDLTLLETEQCQTPNLPFTAGYIDGIRFDEFGNILWYDVLPEHPGTDRALLSSADAIRVPAEDMLHWFKMRRPGQHRSGPELASTLNIGAARRRFSEATVRTAEIAAAHSVMLETQMTADDADAAEPMSTFPISHGMFTALPMNYKASQMKAEHPNSTYSDFLRSLISEQSRPLSMPYNAAACDSSTYSFASGKLDTLCYRAALDVERSDCNDLVLTRIFSAWFKEWTIVARAESFTPNHQWDWPQHPVIDAVQEATAIDTKLKNGTVSLRQTYSDAGKDYEDELAVMAEDTFGIADEETIEKMRKIQVLRNTPAPAMPFVAQVLGLESPEAAEPTPQPIGAPADEPEPAAVA